MANDGACEEVSELESRLQENTEAPDGPDEVLYLSEEALNEILERLWERADDRFQDVTELKAQVLEMRKDMKKLTRLVLDRIGTQEDIHRLADQKDEAGGDNREKSDMAQENEDGIKSKGFDLKQAAKIGAAVLATAGAGYGLGRWHASRIQQKQQNQAPASK